VACFASLRKPAGDVIRIVRSLEILQMARHARIARQVVVVVDMAIRALPRRDCMRSRQREVGHAVIKRSGLPRGCRVALRTI